MCVCCDVCVYHHLPEEKAQPGDIDTDVKLNLGLQYNVQIMGILQRWQNEGPQGIKSVEFDADGDLNDSSYYGTDESYEHVSQDGSIDLAAKDTTIDRNIISAKESGLGVALKQNMPDFNESPYAKHAKA